MRLNAEGLIFNQFLECVLQASDGVLVEDRRQDSEPPKLVKAHDLQRRIGLITGLLNRLKSSGRQMGFVAVQGPDWIAADIAMFLAQTTAVPLACSSSASDAKNALKSVGVCLVDQVGEGLINKWFSGCSKPALVRVDRALADSQAEVLSVGELRGLMAESMRANFVVKVLPSIDTCVEALPSQLKLRDLNSLLAILHERLVSVSPGSSSPFGSEGGLLSQLLGPYLPLGNGDVISFGSGDQEELKPQVRV